MAEWIRRGEGIAEIPEPSVMLGCRGELIIMSCRNLQKQQVMNWLTYDGPAPELGLARVVIDDVEILFNNFLD